MSAIEFVKLSSVVFSLFHVEGKIEAKYVRVSVLELVRLHRVVLLS